MGCMVVSFRSVLNLIIFVFRVFLVGKGKLKLTLAIWDEEA